MAGVGPGSVRPRVLLLAPGVLALLGALVGGLVRLGWAVPTLGLPVAAAHGPLMVSGFLGTLIALERAVALQRRVAVLVPLATGLGALMLLGGSPRAGALVALVGAAGLLGGTLALARRQTALVTAVMGLGAAAWVVGQALWCLGWSVHRVTAWWAAFLVLTIAGERQELSRLVAVPGKAHAAFMVAVGAVAAGPAVALLEAAAGARLLGAGLLALALWLGRWDVARRTVGQPGLPRYVAAALLSGYVWLGASGLLFLAVGAVAAGPRYDAALHALFVGFVFAMVLGHAPVVLPAVVGRAVRITAASWGLLGALHLGLALRVGGDLLGWAPGRRWGGLLNALTVLGFFAVTALSAGRPAAQRPADEGTRAPGARAQAGGLPISTRQTSGPASRTRQVNAPVRSAAN